jgi:hypothetical protein
MQGLFGDTLSPHPGKWKMTARPVPHDFVLDDFADVPVRPLSLFTIPNSLFSLRGLDKN